MIFVKNKKKIRILYHQYEDAGGWQRDFAETNMYWSIKRKLDGLNLMIYQWECPAISGWRLEI